MNGGPDAPTAADYAQSTADRARTATELHSMMLALIIADLEHNHLLSAETLRALEKLVGLDKRFVVKAPKP